MNDNLTKPKKNTESINLQDLIKSCMSTSDPVLYQYFINLKNRNIIINQDICDNLIEYAIMPILNWNIEDADIEPNQRQPITIYLNTAGGAISDGFALCNIIEQSKTPIHIVTLGMAASMGAYIAMSAPKGNRKCYEFSTFLIHAGSIVLAGNTNDVESTIKYYTDMKKDIEAFIYRHTKISKELYKKMQKEEWYLSSKEALRLGIVDEIITFEGAKKSK